MQIGAISFSPYIYNTNALRGSSLSRISSIGDDLLTAKTDYSSLTDESLNENPLKRGQTSDFAAVLDRQLYMGRMNASRLMKPEEETLVFDAAEEVQMEDSSFDKSAMESNLENGRALLNFSGRQPVKVQAEAMEDFQPVSKTEDMFRMQAEGSLFQMRRAAEAYQMNMMM